MDHLQNIFPNLKKGHWAAKLDLKDAYFHIPIHDGLKPYLRHKVGDQVWEFQAGCFGLNIMPQVFMQVMKTFEKKWRGQGLQVYIYLDDILLVAPTPKLVTKHLTTMVQDLVNSGFKINLKKSVLEPSQQVHHLGFLLNFEVGKLQLAPQRLKGVRKELGKFVTKTVMSKRQVAAILGKVRANLFALPFLRAFTDQLHQFLCREKDSPWESKHHLPGEIKQEILEVGKLLQDWSGRPFPQKPSQQLHSDSSTYAWGGVDINSNAYVQEYWRDQHVLHINVKELQAAINTVKSLSKKGEVVELAVDNQVVFYYLTKGGGRKSPFNKMLQPFFRWCMENNVTLQVKWVPSEECLADPLSRWSQDRGDYSLDRLLFQFLQKHFAPHILLQTDLFASPGNKKLESFVSRWPHWEATAVDALACPLQGMGGLYANPPWSVIQKFLARLNLYPQAQVLMVVPFWASAIWWPQLIKLKVPNTPCFKILPYPGMFTNCWGEKMPPPRWPLLCILCSGKFWKGNKFKIRPLTISWEETLL